MGYSERIIGFSTGAVSKGDFGWALDALRRAGVRAVELSALREQELPKLANSLKDLDLADFEYVSVHAPTKFTEIKETEAVRLLEAAANRKLPIVVHPDSVQIFSAWNAFGSLLLVENMDKRKGMGRTADELKQSFEVLPNAGLCFDVAHARQVDPSMVEATQILVDFGDRLREIHASGVTTRSVHGVISNAAGSAYAGIAHLIPHGVPIILESPVQESSIVEEIAFARNVFSPWLERLLTDVDDVLDVKIDSLRKRQAENFLSILKMTRISLQDFEAVITHLPTGGPYNPGDILLSARDLWARLSDLEKTQLQEHLLRRMREIAREYPELKSKFQEQFADV